MHEMDEQCKREAATLAAKQQKMQKLLDRIHNSNERLHAATNEKKSQRSD